MISATTMPETWQAGPSDRPCQGSYFQHPMSQADYEYQAAMSRFGISTNSGPIYYDNYGHCQPFGSTVVLPAIDTGLSIWTIIFWGGVIVGGYYLWTHRKKLGL